MMAVLEFKTGRIECPDFDRDWWILFGSGPRAQSALLLGRFVSDQ